MIYSVQIINNNFNNLLISWHIRYAHEVFFFKIFRVFSLYTNIYKDSWKVCILPRSHFDLKFKWSWFYYDIMPWNQPEMGQFLWTLIHRWLWLCIKQKCIFLVWCIVLYLLNNILKMSVASTVFSTEAAPWTYLSFTHTPSHSIFSHLTREVRV